MTELSKSQKKKILLYFFRSKGVRALSFDRCHPICGEPKGYNDDFYGCKYYHWNWVDLLDWTYTSYGTLHYGKKDLACLWLPDSFTDQSHPHMNLRDVLDVLVDVVDQKILVATHPDDITEKWRSLKIDVENFSFERTAIEMDVKQEI